MGVDSAHTLFRQLFLHEKKVSGGSNFLTNSLIQYKLSENQKMWFWVG